MKKAEQALQPGAGGTNPSTIQQGEQTVKIIVDKIETRTNATITQDIQSMQVDQVNSPSMTDSHVSLGSSPIPQAIDVDTAYEESFLQKVHILESGVNTISPSATLQIKMELLQGFSDAAGLPNPNSWSDYSGTTVNPILLDMPMDMLGDASQDSQIMSPSISSPTSRPITPNLINCVAAMYNKAFQENTRTLTHPVPSPASPASPASTTNNTSPAPTQVGSKGKGLGIARIIQANYGGFYDQNSDNDGSQKDGNNDDSSNLNEQVGIVDMDTKSDGRDDENNDKEVNDEADYLANWHESRAAAKLLLPKGRFAIQGIKSRSFVPLLSAFFQLSPEKQDIILHANDADLVSGLESLVDGMHNAYALRTGKKRTAPTEATPNQTPSKPKSKKRRTSAAYPVQMAQPDFGQSSTMAWGEEESAEESSEEQSSESSHHSEYLDD